MRVRRVAAVVTAGACVTVSACSSTSGGQAAPSTTPAPTASLAPPAPSLARFYDQKLTWTSCHGAFQCTSFIVPLDYAHPDRATLKIATVRLKAKGKRIGSVVINPGGPGGSGIDYALNATSVITAPVRKQFDVVGFDPRGVGESSPIRCLSPSALDRFIAVDPTPDTPSEVTALVSSSKAFARGCQQRSGRLLPYVGTVSAARDMDILRAALGDAKFTYIGKSYGTFLGATYAQLFPTRVRALILDGAVDPALPAREIDRTQAGGFEVALTAFLKYCVANECPLGSSYAAAQQRLEQLIASADRAPLPADGAPGDDGRKVNEGLAVLGLASALYSRLSWDFLVQALGEALRGDGSDLLRAADNLTERNDNGTFSNLSESNMAINCIDRPLPRSFSTYQRDAAAWSKQYPHFGSLLAYGDLPCAFWPVPATGRPAPTTARGAPPILVIGTIRDPATPYAWSQALARELSGVLLSYNGDGHTIYGEGSSCVNRIGDAYLLTLTVPRDGTRC